MDVPVYQDTVIKINLDHIAYNIKQIKQLAGPAVDIAAVVKANGYGHGAIALAPVLMTHGAAMLAVANLKEAIELKEQFPQYPVLIMGLTPDRFLPYVLEYSIIQTIDSYHQADELNKLAKAAGKSVQVHIKYDTGFHRLGFSDTEQSFTEILSICRMSHLAVAGIYSHLALTDDQSNQVQYQKLLSIISKLKQNGIAIQYQHIADSIAFVDYRQYHLNLVRTGAILYGLKGFHKGSLDLRQALTFHTRISHITAVSQGEGVSYDYLWKAPCSTRVATLPFGYADGYPRSLRDKGWVSIHGKKAPVIGVICMDQCMVDLTGIPEAKIGDPVTIYGDGSCPAPDIDTVSRLAGTNKNEIVARLTSRPAKIYIQSKPS